MAQADPAAGREPTIAGALVVQSSPRRRITKSAKLITLLQRPEGASVAELMAATGWMAHSVRAALTGLRKQNRELTRHKDASSTSRYHLRPAS